MLKVCEFEEILKGRSLGAKVVTSLVVSLRKHQRSLDMNRMIEYANTTKSEVNSCYKRLKRHDLFQELETRIMPNTIVNQKAHLLSLQPEVKRLALLIAENFVNNNVEEGKKPATIAGVCF